MKQSVRLSMCLAAVASVLTAGVATAAAPGVACSLVTDKVGDGTGFVFTDRDYLPNDPNVDLVSGDIASDAKKITAVIRTSALELSDASAPTGRTYYANFTVNAVKLYLAVAMDGSGEGTFTGGYIDTTRKSLGGATGVIDTKAKEVRITAPVSLFAAQASLKAGTEITDLNLLAQRYIGNRSVGGVTPSADAAEGGKAYKVGAASCVKVGK